MTQATRGRTISLWLYGQIGWRVEVRGPGILKRYATTAHNTASVWIVAGTVLYSELAGAVSLRPTHGWLQLRCAGLAPHPQAEPGGATHQQERQRRDDERDRHA